METISQPDALICLFDDDSQVDDDYFASLTKAAAADETAMAFCPRLMISMACVLERHFQTNYSEKENKIEEQAGKKLFIQSRL